MADENIEILADGMPVTAEKTGFDPGALMACDACGRANPPNRPTCLYCGERIAAAVGRSVRITGRRLDPRENGFNVVVTAAGPGSIDRLADELARMIGTERDILEPILSAGVPLPIARVATDAEAFTISEFMKQNGVQATVVRDDMLLPEKDPVRLRSLEIADGKLVLTTLNARATTALAPEQVVLIFEGAILTTNTVTAERRGLRTAKTIDEAQTSTDQSVLDIYSRNEHIGRRVSTNGFDFSFLGEQKSLMAEQNIRTLATKIRSWAPAATFVNDYLRHRRLLEHCWETEEQRNSLGLQRTGLSRRAFGSAVRSSNLHQLNKYSRLRRHLL